MKSLVQISELPLYLFQLAREFRGALRISTESPLYVFRTDVKSVGSLSKAIKSAGLLGNPGHKVVKVLL